MKPLSLGLVAALLLLAGCKTYNTNIYTSRTDSRSESRTDSRTESRTDSRTDSRVGTNGQPSEIPQESWLIQVILEHYRKQMAGIAGGFYGHYHPEVIHIIERDPANPRQSSTIKLGPVTPPDPAAIEVRILEPQPAPILTKPVPQGESPLRHDRPDDPLYRRDR